MERDYRGLYTGLCDVVHTWRFIFCKAAAIVTNLPQEPLWPAISCGNPSKEHRSCPRSAKCGRAREALAGGGFHARKCSLRPGWVWTDGKKAAPLGGAASSLGDRMAPFLLTAAAVGVGRLVPRGARITGRLVAGRTIRTRLADLRMRGHVPVMMMAHLGGSRSGGRQRDRNCRCHKNPQHRWSPLS